MPELDINLIGKQLKTFQYEVSKEKIKEFARAIHEDNPIYFCEDTAKKNGYAAIPAPLTFPTCISFWGYPGFLQEVGKLGVDIKRLLHLKENYEYINPIYAGMTVACQVSISDVKVGKMNMMSFLIKMTEKETDKHLVDAVMTIVLRPKGM